MAIEALARRIEMHDIDQWLAGLNPRKAACAQGRRCPEVSP